MSLSPAGARAIALSVLIGCVLALSGCGQNGSGATKASSTVGSKAAAGEASAGASGSAGALEKGAAVPGTAAGGPSQVKIDARVGPDVQALVRKATVTVRVKDIATAVDRAEQSARDADGLVAAEQVQIDSVPGSKADLTLRVPNDSLDAFLHTLRALGSVISTDGSTEDVTGQVADVKSRVTTQQRSIERVRALLAKSANIEDVVRVEAELSRREADLESLEAQQRVLADRTALATVILRLTTAPTPVAKPVDRSGFLGGLRSGWHVFIVLTVLAVTVLGAVLPFALAALLLLALAWPVRRRLVSRRGAAIVSTDAAA